MEKSYRPFPVGVLPLFVYIQQPRVSVKKSAGRGSSFVAIFKEVQGVYI